MGHGPINTVHVVLASDTELHSYRYASARPTHFSCEHVWSKSEENIIAQVSIPCWIQLLLM